MPGPTINDDFWFKKSEEIVNGSIKRLNEGLDKISKYFVALWAIYTVASIFTIEYLEFTKPQYYIVIIIPHVLLFVGRWVSLAGQLPKTIEFAYNIPDEIEKAYITTYNSKRTFLGVANFISLIATIAVVLALIFSFEKNNEFKNAKYLSEALKKEEEEEKKNRIKPYLQLVLNNDNKVVITAENQPNQSSILKVYRINKLDTLLVKSKEYVTNSKGLIHEDGLKLQGSDLKKYLIAIQWKVEETNESYSIAKEIELK